MEISHVTVIGGGQMGSGIAQVAAQSGYNVSLVEVNESLLEKAKANIKLSAERLAKKQFKEDASKVDEFVSTVISRISGTTDIHTALSKTDIVIEAIVENVDAKKKLFSSLDKIAQPKTIFASNTSSIPISEIAKSTNRLDRFLGLHFFNPVPMMKLLEVIRIPETSDETYETCMKFGTKLGKTCVTCKDTLGFIVNRLLGAYTTEAVRMLERDDAKAKDIDIAMKLGASYPMGPFELLDYIGLDTTQSVRETFARYDPQNPLYEPSPTIDKLVKEGKLGVKTGEDYTKSENIANTNNLKMVKPTIYHNYFSPPSRFAVITANHIGLDFEVKNLNLFKGEQFTPEFIAINPTSTVPALVDGNVKVFDSTAIGIYLVEKYAKDDQLYPKDLVKRTMVNERLLYVGNYLFPRLFQIIVPGLYGREVEVPKYKFDDIIRGYQAIEKFLSVTTYLAANTITLADLYLWAIMESLAQVIPIDTEKFPHFNKWMQKMKEHPSYKMNKDAAVDHIRFYRACIEKAKKLGRELEGSDLSFYQLDFLS
ncbi:CLUMA_CG021289, isoform A [Clunio marinus]|uniref:CLUMA_CG021289, isoform A n=1 Tax=Clunio marinus TaxID=568069 RepID=A0A1J1J886_9DIPT|nr:CLUMA_CG021289, isoform A [Clunio marinus]